MTKRQLRLRLRIARVVYLVIMTGLLLWFMINLISGLVSRSVTIEKLGGETAAEEQIVATENSYMKVVQQRIDEASWPMKIVRGIVELIPCFCLCWLLSKLHLGMISTMWLCVAIFWMIVATGVYLGVTVKWRKKYKEREIAKTIVTPKEAIENLEKAKAEMDKKEFAKAEAKRKEDPNQWTSAEFAAMVNKLLQQRVKK